MEQVSRAGVRRQERGRRPSRGSPGTLGGRILVACACLAAPMLPGGCCLVRPPDAKTLVTAGDAGWRTPEAAFETFRVAFGADLPELEFRSLSHDFRRREGLSYQSYRIAREKLIHDQPFLTLLARAEIVQSVKVSAKRHRLVVRAAGKQFEFELVREDWFQTYAGDVSIADGPLDFPSAVRVQDAKGGKSLTASVFVPTEDLEGVDLSTLTGMRVEQVWKIDRFGEPQAP